jgi:hypothetical protein
MASEEVFYDVAMRQLDNQMQRIGALDAKGTTVFAFSSSLLALFAILASLGPALPTEGIRHAFIGLILAAAIVYGLILVFLYRAYKPNSAFSLRPHLDELQEQCKQHPKDKMQVWVALNCARSLCDNEPKLTAKARNLLVALFAVPVETGLLAAASVVALLGR